MITLNGCFVQLQHRIHWLRAVPIGFLIVMLILSPTGGVWAIDAVFGVTRFGRIALNGAPSQAA